jgi:plastocyanin
MRHRVLALVSLALACGAGAAATVQPGTRHEILMRGNSFTPNELTITVGDTIVWKNGDIVRHNAVRAQLFDSKELRSGESYEWVASDTGTYNYRCTIHQRMRGTLTIVAPPAP